MSMFILTIELVPKTSWYSNMRKVMNSQEWDILRKEVYAKYNHHCGICNDPGMLHCHEIWNYDDENHIQTLQGFIALCVMCHHVKHIGYANILAGRGELDMQNVINHFVRVNQCPLTDYTKQHMEAFDKWEERSQFVWNIDLGEYNYLKEKTKCLKILSE